MLPRGRLAAETQARFAGARCAGARLLGQRLRRLGTSALSRVSAGIAREME